MTRYPYTVARPSARSRLWPAWEQARSGKRVLVLFTMERRELWLSDGRGGVEATCSPEPKPCFTNPTLRWVHEDEQARP